MKSCCGALRLDTKYEIMSSELPVEWMEWNTVQLPFPASFTMQFLHSILSATVCSGHIWTTGKSLIMNNLCWMQPSVVREEKKNQIHTYKSLWGEKISVICKLTLWIEKIMMLHYTADRQRNTLVLALVFEQFQNEMTDRRTIIAFIAAYRWHICCWEYK